MTHTAIATVILMVLVGFCKVEQPKTTNSTSWVNAQNSSTGVPVAQRTGREHVPEPAKATNYEDPPPKQDHIKPSVPKKGVIQPEDFSNKSEPVLRRTKPLITESDTDYIEANSSKETGSITVNEIQSGWVSNKINRAKYVTPIVAVIMSVPFVAVVISLIYKRGADWWQHRNYKRMDFLIDGMYQN